VSFEIGKKMYFMIKNKTLSDNYHVPSLAKFKI